MGKSARMIKRSITAKSEIVFERKLLDKPSSVHWHNFCELDIIVSGYGTTFINGSEYLCKPGMMVFMSPSDFHDYRANELEIFNIQFSEESVDSHILHALINLNSRMVCMGEKDRSILRNICDLVEGTALGKVYRNLYLKRMVESILILFLQNVDSKKEGVFRAEPDIIQEIVIYINAHFAENLTLKDIAKAFHLNENYLCCLFRQHAGEGYKSYLRKIKLEHAEKLILFTNMSITEIALSSGYNTQSHFNREFKNMFHVTPSKMRQTRERSL